ncbi:MAG: DUF6625 family protein [Leptolyngbyaceae cyanobacterium bins.59]|nr:DUF6625 family protein [Leptolyngbyaceae cyanobacterium bins.59]
MASVCLIVPFFAQISPFFWKNNPKAYRFPNYFDHFVESFSKTKGVDLKIFTNIPSEPYKEKYQGNISFYQMSLNQFFRLAVKQIGFNPGQFYPYQFGLRIYSSFYGYKICDFKPAFGVIFSDFLKGYEFWGYCDIDMIIGNLGKFFRDDNVQKYDLITVPGNIAGYMALYRNTESMNNLFRTSPDYLKVFESPKNYIFDEYGREDIVAMKQILKKGEVKVHYMENLVHNDCGIMNLDRDWKYRWENGTLIDTLADLEVGAFHIVKTKKAPDFVIEPLVRNQPFEVTKKGIRAVS